ncbi:transaldolase (plasmid) [Nocardioides sp. JS614]|nr:transaldolase [Nocardioides sp. JS614]
MRQPPSLAGHRLAPEVHAHRRRARRLPRRAGETEPCRLRGLARIRSHRRRQPPSLPEPAAPRPRGHQLGRTHWRTRRIMSRLHRLFDEQGQSPWLDNLTRPHLRDGTLADLVARGVRGVTANPTIVAKAIEASDAYDDQFKDLLSAGHDIEDAYWELALTDVAHALQILRPTFHHSGGHDGFVSIEVAPQWARDIEATIADARYLHERIHQPNLLVKVPATAEGVHAVEALIGEGRSINVTLVFSLTRYREILDAYLSGMEAFALHGGDLTSIRSVASFFVSRVDTEVDRRLEELGTEEALALRGRAAIAQAKLAYQLFRSTHSGPRWARLARRGAQVQRALWASTSTKNPHYPDTLYVDNLIGPDTVNTLPEPTIDAFEDHGTVVRTVDAGLADANFVMHALSRVGIDMDDVGLTLERQGLATFAASVNHVLDALDAKAHVRSAI